MDPICQLCQGIMAEKDDVVQKMLKGIGIELKGDDKDLKGKQLLKKVMQTWIPAGDALMGMFVMKLPSPVAAQKCCGSLFWCTFRGLRPTLVGKPSRKFMYRV